MGTQLLFFHQGEHIGIDCASQQQVVSIEDRGTQLIVAYKDRVHWKKPADQTLQPQPNYKATMTFFCVAHNIQLGTIGEFPNQDL